MLRSYTSFRQLQVRPSGAHVAKPFLKKGESIAVSSTHEVTKYLAPPFKSTRNFKHSRENLTQNPKTRQRES